ncbi:MAG: bifunctional aspartate kinase/homoserine dehydrogenase I, partial [Flavihumibacter sp.]|nr:bifunctional aspartate kinase/homoserine dehydrogenase I [Flavihumibacter sp.]
MKVLKFGGTSMGSASAMKQVIEIVKSKRNGKPVVAVVSAMSGTTDVLLNAGILAGSFDEGYKELLKKSEERHLETARSIINVLQQSATLSLLKTLFNEIEDICNGIFLLGELTNRTKDKLMSYGELLSSQLITA